MRIVKKILNHIEEYGFADTVRWLFNCLEFRIKKGKVKSIDFDCVKIPKKEKGFLIKKTQPSIFIIASIPYYDIGGGQRCSQLAKTFNKMGFNVHYLYAMKSSESKIFNIPMPMSSHLYIDNKIISKIEKIVSKDDLFIFEAPLKKFNQLLDFAIEKKCKIIYENIDNWETSLGNSIYDEKTLKKMLKYSHLLVGTAKPLVKQINDYLKKYKITSKKVIYLANAVDDEIFCGLKELEKPEDLVIGKKTLLYYGSLWGEWFDWELIIGLAKNHPDYSINLIGDFAGIINIKKKCPENIHFLGLKKQIDLPSYLKHVDYTMIPFKTGEIGDYVSPLKIFEYISMYTKVLCTKLPDIKGYPNVFTGNTINEWENILEMNIDVDVEAANNFIEDNTWCSRVSSIIEHIYPEYNSSILNNNLSIIILNYNNKNIIFKSLNTLLKYNKIYNYEIIVVDNGSKDGSYELLKEKYAKKIKLLQNSKNGCSSGRNLGVQHATKEYLMFLDSDQWITSNYWILPYENILKNAENIGLIGWAAGFFNSKQLAYHVVDSFPYRYMPCNSLCRYDIGYLGSGGMLVKKELFEKVEGFDLNYDPTCYEDTDFSLKIRNTGKEIYYCPYLGVIHLPHQTTKSGSKEHTNLILKKGDYFVTKWNKINPELFKYKK